MESQNFKAKSSSKLFLFLAVIGLAGILYSFFLSGHGGDHAAEGAHHGNPQFWLSYLTSFIFYLCLSLGGLFFVIIQHLTRAGWSVVVRRVAENISANLQWIWILSIPIIIFGRVEIFSWFHPHEEDAILNYKAGYLNEKFFYARTVFFFLSWILLSTYFLKKSVAQDKSGDKNLTRSMQKMSAFAIILYAITETFFAVDWIMALNAHWFSTIFGVYYFACSAFSIMALLIIVIVLLQKNGYVKGIINVEHFHDLGKLLFGFNVFWTYIAFSQWMLIWYANLGEETTFYHLRILGGWKTLSTAMPIIHFAIPFLFLLSRNIKRNVPLLTIGAVWLFIVNYIDIYWLIVPNINAHDLNPILEGTKQYTQVGFGLTDISCILFMGGLFFYGLIKNLEKSSLVPTKDPRLSESINFTNA